MCVAGSICSSSRDRGVAKPEGRHAVAVASLDGLARVRRGGTALAVWERGMSSWDAVGIAAAIAGPVGVRLSCAPRDVEGALLEAVPDVSGRSDLARDATCLASALARIAGTSRVGLRLEAVPGDSCRLFHVDRVRYRLATTYVGRGTQWLDSVDAARLVRGAGVPDDAVTTIPTGAVAVFRGSLAGGGTTGLVHRSPPRRQGDPVRLFLSIDPEPAQR